MGMSSASASVSGSDDLNRSGGDTSSDDDEVCTALAVALCRWVAGVLLACGSSTRFGGRIIDTGFSNILTGSTQTTFHKRVSCSVVVTVFPSSPKAERQFHGPFGVGVCVHCVRGGACVVGQPRKDAVVAPLFPTKMFCACYITWRVPTQPLTWRKGRCFCISHNFFFCGLASNPTAGVPQRLR